MRAEQPCMRTLSFLCSRQSRLSSAIAALDAAIATKLSPNIHDLRFLPTAPAPRSQQAICFGLTLRSLTRKEVLLRLDEVGTRGVGVARKRDELLVVGPGARPVTSPVGSHGSARKRAVAVRIIAQ